MSAFAGARDTSALCPERALKEQINSWPSLSLISTGLTPHKSMYC
jgi:hypothetical protein